MPTTISKGSMQQTKEEGTAVISASKQRVIEVRILIIFFSGGGVFLEDSNFRKSRDSCLRPKPQVATEKEKVWYHKCPSRGKDGPMVLESVLSFPVEIHGTQRAPWHTRTPARIANYPTYFWVSVVRTPWTN